MDKRRVHVWISGRVQGVFFRAFTRDAAYRSKVAGWVRNLPDGSVEAVFEGHSDAVSTMLEWCHEGSPLSRVQAVQVREEAYSGEFTSFRITH